MARYYHYKDKNKTWCFCLYYNTLSDWIKNNPPPDTPDPSCPKCGYPVGGIPPTDEWYASMSIDYDDSRSYYSGERSLDSKFDCRTGQLAAA